MDIGGIAMELTTIHGMITGKELMENIITFRKAASRVLVGACLNNEGDIICPKCDCPREFCKCQQAKD